MEDPFFISAFINIFVIVVTLVTTPLKVYAVWLASKNNHKKWFVALIILNTIGILELVYIFHVLKKSWKEVEIDFNKDWKAITKKQ
ncbi:MAG: DUF5652 family protein [Candidatus Paceibacterota bacterium]